MRSLEHFQEATAATKIPETSGGGIFLCLPMLARNEQFRKS
jgi:hypothetical protein